MLTRLTGRAVQDPETQRPGSVYLPEVSRTKKGCVVYKGPAAVRYNAIASDVKDTLW